MKPAELTAAVAAVDTAKFIELLEPLVNIWNSNLKGSHMKVHGDYETLSKAMDTPGIV